MEWRQGLKGGSTWCGSCGSSILRRRTGGSSSLTRAINFNEENRTTMLCAVCHKWPSGARNFIQLLLPLGHTGDQGGRRDRSLPLN